MLGRLERLEDADARAAELARLLPQALALRSVNDPAIGQALRPSVESALAETLEKNPHLLGTALRAAVRSALRHPLAATAAALRHKARTLFRRSEARCEQRVLIHRPTHAVLQQAARPCEDPETGRSIANMLAYLAGYLRDEAALARYALLEHLRVEDLAYAIHAGPQAILISVIRGPAPDGAIAAARTLLEKIHREHAAELANPPSPFPALLPELAAER